MSRWLVLLALTACTEAPDPLQPVRALPAAAGTGEGSPDPLDVLEHFVAGADATDLLIVVDAQAVEARAALAAEVGSLLATLDTGPHDWHAAVVAANEDDPALQGRLRGDPPWITRHTPDRDLELADRIGSVTGDGPPLGRDVVVAALDEHEVANLGFRRGQANLVLLFVSAAPDASELSADGFLAWSADEPARLVTALGVVDDGSCGDLDADTVEVIDALGGLTWPVCDPLDMQVAGDIGFAAAALSQAFPLQQEPDPSSLVVFVEMGDVHFRFEPETEVRWDPRANSVAFTEFIPSAGMGIHVSYLPVGAR